jgi:FkbM family methyltransferase
MISTLFKQLLGYGQTRSQWLFEKMYYHAIFGMNYSSPNYFENGEIEAMRYVRKRLSELQQSQPLIFDVGANVGDYTKTLRDVFGANAGIFCFEPSVRTFELLQTNISPDRKSEAFNFGFGNRAEKRTLFFDQPTSTIASLYGVPSSHSANGDSTEQIEIRTVDQFCVERSIDRIHFLKIDVEGHELQVLEGAAQTIGASKVDFIQFEFGFRQMDSKNYFRDFYDLLGKRYRLYRIVQDGIYPVTQYHESLEVFVGVSNFIAERRSLE